MGPGTVIAQKYELVRCLGEGAMGSVWEAVNLRTHRTFALKLLRPASQLGPELAERMLREASVAGRLAHPNVIEVYDVGETAGGEPFLVMERLAGETLEAVLERKKRLDAPRACAIGAEVAAALGAAHSAGVVHRDLKPANVFLHEEPGRGRIVKVLDFGVSKLMNPEHPSATVTGVPIGTPAYMSPEQAEGQRDVDHRTDLWSLGVVLFELVAGRLPFGGASAYAVVGEVLHGPIPRLSSVVPDVDPRLDTLIARCLERDRSRRIQSARELGAELEALLPKKTSALLADFDEDATLTRRVEQVSLAGVQAIPTSLPAKTRGVRPLGVIIGASVFGAVLGLGLVLALVRHREPEPTDAIATSAAAALVPAPEPSAPPSAAASEVAPALSAPSATPSASAPRATKRHVAPCPKDKLLIDPVTGKATCVQVRQH